VGTLVHRDRAGGRESLREGNRDAFGQYSLYAFRSLFSRAKVEQDLDESCNITWSGRLKENVAAGVSREEGAPAALKAFQDLEQRKEECRDMRGLESD